MEETCLLGCWAVWMVIGSRRFEETCRLHLQDYESVN